MKILASMCKHLNNESRASRRKCISAFVLTRARMSSIIAVNGSFRAACLARTCALYLLTRGVSSHVEWMHVEPAAISQLRDSRAEYSMGCLYIPSSSSMNGGKALHKDARRGVKIIHITLLNHIYIYQVYVVQQMDTFFLILYAS